MHDILKFALLSILLLGHDRGPASGGEWTVRPKPADTTWYEGALTPTSDGSLIVSPSVRNVPHDGDRPRTQGILATATWLKGAFSTETEVAANRAVVPGDNPSARMMRLGVTGSTGLIRYGMKYRTADQAFHGGGQEQKEAWGEWRNGSMAIRSAFGRRPHPEADAAGSRTEQHYHRVDMSWNRPAWPHLAFSLAQNAASNTMNPLSLYPQRADHHRVEAAVGYGGERWEAKMASSYGLETDLMNHGAESRVNTQTVTASLRPLATLTITPTLGYRAERPEWSGARIDSPSASLAMSYKQSQRLSMTAVGNYSAMRSTDRLVELDMIGGKGIVSWELEPLRDWKPQVSLEGGYNLQVNRLMPSAQTENISGLLRLVLATM